MLGAPRFAGSSLGAGLRDQISEFNAAAADRRQMSPLPAQFTDRWGTRAPGLSYEDSVCWHLLLGANAGARAIAGPARQRLARFGGLEMTPARWLHVTVLLAGPAAAISRGDMAEMLAGPGRPWPGPRPSP